MSLFSNNNNNNNNKTEVNYTGKELFRLTGNDGSYDAKISAKGDGSFDYYETTSGWRDHSHKHVDANGKTTYNRPEGSGHKWTHRQKDYVAKWFENLSFEELQYIESIVKSDYLKKSAKHFMQNSANEEIERIHIKKLKK